MVSVFRFASLGLIIIGAQELPGSGAPTVLKPAAESVGLPWVTFHSLRHTCASLLFAAGKNIKQVQEWLGHADPAFTLRTYVHLMDEGLGDAEFMDAAVSADPTRVNSGSTRGPETGDNRATADDATTADLEENHDQTKTAASL